MNLRETVGSAEELRARLADTERRASELAIDLSQWRERHAELQAEKRVLSRSANEAARIVPSSFGAGASGEQSDVPGSCGHSAGETTDGH